MNFSSVIIGTFVYINAVLCEHKLCDIRDPLCVTETCRQLFSPLILGDLGVEPSDPLRQDVIKGNLPTLWYKLTNGSLSGMKKCQVELMKFIPKELKYESHISCPHLALELKCVIKRKEDVRFIKGTGTCMSDLHNYHMYFKGNYEMKNNKNGKKHIHLIHKSLDLEAKGNVEYNYTKLSSDDEDTADIIHQFTKEDWQMSDKLIHQFIIEAFMKKYLYNINSFLDLVPTDNIFSSTI